MEIALAASADDVSVEWFPHLRRGMLRGAEWDHERGVEWAGVRVEIRKIYTHPIDTTARGCEFHGVSFIGDLRKRSVMLP